MEKKTSKLWLLEAPRPGYDIFTKCVVVADTEDEVRLIHPTTDNFTPPCFRFVKNRGWQHVVTEKYFGDTDWVHPESLAVTYLGETDLVSGQCVMSEFHCG